MRRELHARFGGRERDCLLNRVGRGLLRGTHQHRSTVAEEGSASFIRSGQSATQPNDRERSSSFVGLFDQIGSRWKSADGDVTTQFIRHRELRLLKVHDLRDHAAVDGRVEFVDRERDWHREFVGMTGRRMQTVDQLDRRVQLDAGKLRHVAELGSIRLTDGQPRIRSPLHIVTRADKPSDGPGGRQLDTDRLKLEAVDSAGTLYPLSPSTGRDAMIHQRVRDSVLSRLCLSRPAGQTARERQAHQHPHQPTVLQCRPKIGNQAESAETEQFRKEGSAHRSWEWRVGSGKLEDTDPRGQTRWGWR